MGRRTISNLSRELRVSRPRIYRAIDRLGFEKKAGGEYPLDEWEMLKIELSTVAENNYWRREDAKSVTRAAKTAAKKTAVTAKTYPEESLAGINHSTLKVRLDKAKQEYDYNRRLITSFQAETDEYIKTYGRTTVMSHNGAMTAIPSILNLEKYIKLNIALSKLITDVESDLDLAAEGGADPFA